MKKLTVKEKEIMDMFWAHGSMLIRDLLDLYKEPKPHYNTVATFLKLLEEKGFLRRESYRNMHRYEPLVSEKEYRTSAMNDVVSQLYNNSYIGVVSQFIEDEAMDVEELKELIQRIENAKK